ncbi:MAG: Na/Pi cotransporter family protein [Verrucomicrobiae bacterium]|nr:Na/Pi cotransporter family protein [Verrucomicrobiae bacterium]
MLPILAETDSLAIGPLLMGVLGGLALFLFGMDLMSRSLKVVAGSRMRQFLGRITTNPVKGVVAGAATTAVIQSSSVTTVLVIGFISAGLMTLSQAIGVIMGANIGTAVTAQIAAFKITQYALVLVAGGFLWRLIGGGGKGEFYGSMVMGLGLLLYGMELMSEATHPLRTYQPFIDWMRHMDHPAAGILTAMLVTAVIQSSAATTVIVIVLAGQGVITLEAGIALIFGANIGTCVTAMLGAIGKPREALQAALAHLIFNVAGVAIWVAFIPELADLVRSISPQMSRLEGAARLAAEAPRQIANAHTVFNIVSTLLLVGFTKPLAKLIQRLVPERLEDSTRFGEVRFLDDMFLETPSVALDLTRKELSRLGAGALKMLHSSLNRVLYGSRQDLEELRRDDNEIDALHAAIVGYLGKLSQRNLHEDEAVALRDCLAAANHFESIGDMVETDLVEAGLERLRHGVEISSGTGDRLLELHRKVSWSVASVIRALVEQDLPEAQSVIDAKHEVNALADAAELYLVKRLGAAEPQRGPAFRIESDIIENLKRIYYFAKRIARMVEPIAGVAANGSESPKAPPGD